MRKQETPNLALGAVFGALRDALTKPGVTADGSWTVWLHLQVVQEGRKLPLS